MPAKHVYELYVRTTPEELWAAITDPGRTERYWRGVRVESTWEPGASVRWVRGDGTASTHGEVVESDPPRRLVTTWNRVFADGVTEDPSRVTWEIEARGAVCKLRLVHDDFHGVTRTFGIAGRGWPIVLSSLKTIVESGADLGVPDSEFESPIELTDTDAIDHREWGRKSNNRVWALLDDGHPAPDTFGELVDAAHASLWHWSYAGGELERERGEWMLAHVYAVVGDGPTALRHAQRCWELTEAKPDGSQDFDHAYACEALARAYKVNGDSALAAEWFERARKAGEQIANDKDREIFEGDLAS